MPGGHRAGKSAGAGTGSSCFTSLLAFKSPGRSSTSVERKGVAFGDAAGLGSIPPCPEPVVSISSTHSGHGYWLVTTGGDVYAFDDAGCSGNG